MLISTSTLPTLALLGLASGDDLALAADVLLGVLLVAVEFVVVVAAAAAALAGGTEADRGLCDISVPAGCLVRLLRPAMLAGRWWELQGNNGSNWAEGGAAMVMGGK